MVPRRVPNAVVLLAILAAGCVRWAEGTGPRAPHMPLEEALARQARGEAVLIDVRSRRAFEEGHISGAVSIPGDEIGNQLASIRSLHKLPILYCG